MDIYRFFHPHHNPRLHSTPVRQHELSELEQAASELFKALDRAQRRLNRKPVPPIMPEHLKDVLKAMNFVVTSLQTLCDSHPGDSLNVLADLIQERSQFSGWEGWTSLLTEQIEMERKATLAGTGDRSETTFAQGTTHPESALLR